MDRAERKLFRAMAKVLAEHVTLAHGSHIKSLPELNTALKNIEPYVVEYNNDRTKALMYDGIDGLVWEDAK